MQMTTNGGLIEPKPMQVGRSVAKGRKTHFTGQIVLERGGVEELMDVESHTEMMVALVMRARLSVVDIESQVAFCWTDRGGCDRTHYFDYRVSLRDGSRVAIFVKSAKRAASARVQAQLRAIAAQVTPAFADRVVVMTEQHLDPIETHNAELLYETRASEPEVDALARRALRLITGPVRIRDLVAEIGRDGQGFRAVVRLIGLGELELVDTVRIGHEALVRRRTH